MMNTVVKRTIKLAMFSSLILFSANSQASSVFGKVGYSHYPFHISIGYSDHGRSGNHYYKPRYYGNGGHRYYKPKYYGNGGNHYYKPRYYRHNNRFGHGYNRFGHGYKRYGRGYRHPAYRSHSYSRGHRPQHHNQRYYNKKNMHNGRYIHH